MEPQRLLPHGWREELDQFRPGENQILHAIGEGHFIEDTSRLNQWNIGVAVKDLIGGPSKHAVGDRILKRIVRKLV